MGAPIQRWRRQHIIWPNLSRKLYEIERNLTGCASANTSLGREFNKFYYLRGDQKIQPQCKSMEGLFFMLIFGGISINIKVI